MKRQIIFRGKRLDGKGWIFGHLVKMWGEWHIIDWDDENTAYPIHSETIGQYTGLKDKNGLEIYEGDIVLQQRYGGSKGNMIVRFEKAAFIVGYHQGSSTRKMPMLLNDRSEVVGNIWDNKDLLE